MVEARTNPGDINPGGTGLGTQAPHSVAHGPAGFGPGRRWVRQGLQLWVRRPRPLLLAVDGLWDPASAAAPFADFAAWCRAHPGLACELWLGAGVLADVLGDVADPQAGNSGELRTAAARGAWVQRVLFHYHGEAAVAWPLLPWQHAGAWGATALRGLSLAGLQAQAREHGVLLRAVRPLWPRLLAQLLAHEAQQGGRALDEAWLVEAVPQASDLASAASPASATSGTEARPAAGPQAAGAAHLTLVKLSQGGITSLQRRRLQAPWAPALQRLLEEESPSPPSSPAPSRRLLWLGDAPAGPLPLPRLLTLAPPFAEALPKARGRGPDFLRPEARPGPLAWAWLATSATVLALAGSEAQQAWTMRAQAHAVVPAVEGPRVTSAAAPADPARLVLQQRLHHPWRAVFLASELPTSAGLRWLSLDHRAGAELRLQGLASDVAPVQRLAAALRQQPAWQQVLVARLEVQAAAPMGPAPGATGPQAPAAFPNLDPKLNHAFEIVAQLREEVAP